MPMSPPTAAQPAGRTASTPGDGRLARRIKDAVEGEVLFDAFSRGRYSTDASAYQIEPIGVVVPHGAEDVAAVMAIAAEEGVPVLPRGGGTSQCGQTVGAAIVIDVSKHMKNVLELDLENHTAWVEPGLVLDRLNAFLKPHGLWFPVDVSTGSRATIGGMTGNNSCGARSLHYGNMRDNVRAVDAFLIDGSRMRFGEIPWDSEPQSKLVADLLDLGRREADEIAARFPPLVRRVGGYNIDALSPRDTGSGTVRGSNRPGPNLAHLLVGSEGTLAFSSRIQIELARIPSHKVLGICHFPTFYKAMESTQHIVKLGPAAVELVDRTMIELSRAIPMFRDTIDAAVKGEPDALLLVEFAGEDRDEQHRKLRHLVELMGDLGLPGAVVEVTDPAFQRQVWEVRKSGLNIMMSMKGDGKPISFIEDCAVRLEDLAEYTDRLTNVFSKHGTTGTWYAHASVGCLHVRPVLNLKSEIDVKKMRAIAEEAFAMVREYKGSHSGEHGDGLVRSEFHEAMFGPRMVASFKEVKRAFDPRGLMNPGKIVDPSRMDDRSLLRFKPGYRIEPIETALDWSEWGGFSGAVEMCNNNGACRKSDPGVMCPSFRATGEEKDLTRGRANTLRLAISGQLGPDALVSDEMAETMKLCVGCKGCKRECPTGVDMAKMKIEFLHHYKKRHGLTLRDRLVAYLPRYAALASALAPLMNLRDRIPGLARLLEGVTGFTGRRSLPQWRWQPFDARALPAVPPDKADAVLWVDTFTARFEPENAEAALAVLAAAGKRIHVARAADGGRAPCCGRTFLSAGLVDEARAEAKRTWDALAPYVEKTIPIVGLEPSCLFSLKDEFGSLLAKEQAAAVAPLALTFEEYLVREHKAGRLALDLKPIPGAAKALVHGHCHQKAFAAMGAVEAALALVPGLESKVVESSCCGMAGAFGYDAETYDASMRMGELALLPAARAAGPETILVADGTSCRHQIDHGAGRDAVHVARVLARALEP